MKSLLFILCTFAVGAAHLDLSSLIKKAETQYQGQSSQSIARMFIQRKTWQRELVMNSYTKGRNHVLTIVQEPLRDKGTATLKIEQDMWNYNPKIDRLIKIPSSLMGDGWMGSHFTNDDLVKADKVDELYTLSLLAEDTEKWLILATPKENAAVVWGKIHYTIDKQREIPMEVQYYDEENILVRTLLFDQITNVAGRTLPLRMTMLPMENPQEKTVVVYEKIAFDVEIAPNLFSIRSLKRGQL